MKLKWKVVITINVILILFVSFKIREPAIEQENDGKGNYSVYTSSPTKLIKTKPLLQTLEDKYTVQYENCTPDEDTWKIAADWVKDREIIPEYAPELGRYVCVIFM